MNAPSPVRLDASPSVSSGDDIDAQPAPQRTQVFDWRACWYPVAIVADLPQHRPYHFSLYEEPFVLFRADDGQLVCLLDRCPHRGARLSDGRIVDGRIECLYHGWQFGTGGKCHYIPQLPAHLPMPEKACAHSRTVIERQGLAWMWAGDPAAAAPELIPSIAALDMPGTQTTDYVRDLPYDQTYYIENVIDPAHVHITHHNIIGFREFARPIEMDIQEVSAAGFCGWGKGMGLTRETWGKVEFVAPNIVIYSLGGAGGERVGGTILYSLPMGEDSCRIMLRNFSNAPVTLRSRLTPRWWQHIMIRNPVLETDMQLIMGQKASTRRTGLSLKDSYFPLSTCDKFVVEYRKWLDKFGKDLPFYQGYTSAKTGQDTLRGDSVSLDRLSQHTRLCQSCSRAYDLLKATRRASVLAIPVLLGIATLIEISALRIAMVALAGIALIFALAAHKLIERLE